VIRHLLSRTVARTVARRYSWGVVGQLTGIEVRHGKACLSREGRNCNCRPTYQASAWSARDEKRLRKTFPTLASARVWRAEAQSAIHRGKLRAPTSTTLAEAGEDLIKGMQSGKVRTKSGDVYKPSAVRSYEHALRDRVLPALGAKRLGDCRAATSSTSPTSSSAKASTRRRCGTS
jgi:integrase